MNIAARILLLGTALTLASCVNSTPVSQSLSPRGNPKLAVISQAKKNPNIGYTDVGMQAGMSQGLLGGVVAAAMRAEQLKKTGNLSKQWKATGRDASVIVLDEFRRIFSGAGYILDDAASARIEIANAQPAVTMKGGQYGALLSPFVTARLADGKHIYAGPNFAGTSQTIFSLDSMSPDIYEKALREAAANTARGILYGSNPQAGAPRN